MEKPKVKRLASISRIGKVTDDFYEDLRNAPQSGRKVAWCGGYPTTFPLLRAMDVAYLFEDVYAATAAARHKESKLQQVSADVGYLPEVCSYARTTLGAAHFPEKEKPGADPYYLMPKADFLLYMDLGCSMLTNWSDAGRRHFKVPMFAVITPYVWTKTDEADAIHDLTRQFAELVTFLEDMTHRPMDWERLSRVMADVKQAITYRIDAMDMAGRAVPAPVTFFDWAASIGGVNYAIGTPLAVDVFRDIKNEVQERVARREGALPQERVRVYWEGHMCWPYMRWWGDTLADLGINIIAAKYTHGHFFHRPDLIDPAKPIESLAANSVALLSYSIDLLADQITRFCRDYKLDAIICHETRTCRIFPGPFFEVLDTVSRKLGIPGSFFEGDVADPNFFSPEQARTRVEALVETVLARKEATRV
jgi:benzoyl-CoA reductase subunit B